MKERPIIFNTEMVKAILDGRKTQTRRVIKPQPIIQGNKSAWELQWRITLLERDQLSLLCPYGQEGDRLWVRETWGYHGSSYYMNKNTIHIRYLADGEKRDIDGDIYCSHCGLKTGDIQTPKQNLKYPSNFNDLDEDEQLWIRNNLIRKWWGAIKTIPSIHMPRWASRILLEITKVRAERVQEIGFRDCEAEGIDGRNMLDAYIKNDYRVLWDSINAKRGHGWETNPWVWVISFKRIN